jgi:FkbM family methyltransferase
VFDVGAHVGESVEGFKRLWPDCRIHSFEPQAAVFETLKANTAKYRGVTCNNFALGDAAGERPLHHHNRWSAASSFIPLNRSSLAIATGVHPKAQFDKFDVSAKPVKVDTIDGYAAANDIPHVDIVKLDVQGFEPNVLKGAVQMLSAGRISFILTEIMFDDVYEYRPSFYDIESCIREHGYLLYDISHIYKDLGRGRTHWVDAIYADSRRIRL